MGQHTCVTNIKNYFTLSKLMTDNGFNNSLLIPVLFRKITVIIKAEADKDSREYLFSYPLSPALFYTSACFITQSRKKET